MLNGSTIIAPSVTFVTHILRAGSFDLRVQNLQPFFGGTNQGVTPNRAQLDEAGGLERIVSLTSSGVAATVLERRTAQNIEVAGDSDLIIGRWSDGAIKSFVSAADNVGPNQGFHYLLARGLESPVAIAPGRIEYTLAHATSPTLGSGASAPGTFNANLAIEYGAAPLLGIDGTITFEGAGGFVYTFATTGGAAAPSKAIAFADPDIRGRGGHFSFTTDTGTTNHGFSGQLTGFGSLGDAQGSSVGFAYTVDLSAPTSILGETISGAAIFRSAGNNSAAAPASQTTASIAPTTGLAPATPLPADWSRWAGAVPSGGSTLLPAPGADGGGWSASAAPGYDRLTDPSGRAAAIRKAEALMGGMITFAPTAPGER